MGVSQSVHHFLGGVGARGITLTADDLVSGGQSQFSSKVVFGLGAGGVDLLLVFAVAKRKKEIEINIAIFVQHF